MTQNVEKISFMAFAYLNNVILVISDQITPRFAACMKSSYQYICNSDEFVNICLE